MAIDTYSADDGAHARPTASLTRPTAWEAPVADGPLDATVTLPGSKSLTNRELVLAALAVGPGTLHAPLRSRDSDLMVGALRSLGARIDELPVQDGDPDLRVTPGAISGGGRVDCGLAGTVMRFVPPVAALAAEPVEFDGDEAARRRPMAGILAGLRDLGIAVDDDGRGALPFTVRGVGTVRGGEIAIDASASSQFISGLLLAAPRFERGLTLRHVGERLPSLPHIEMTLACLADRGVTVGTPGEAVWSVEPGPIAGRDVTIEPDLSNAAPFLIAAIVAGGTVRIPGWPARTTQVGAQLAHILPRFGAHVVRDDDALVIDGGAGVRGGARAGGGATLPGVDLDLSAGGELAPAIVALAALASGPSRITGIGHLRGHETDRLAALTAEIGRLGGDVTELENGLEIRPRPLHGGEWRSYQDHRMATAGAIIGLAVPGVVIDDVAATAKTLPGFADRWAATLHAVAG